MVSKLITRYDNRFNFIKKGSDQIVSNSTTLVDITDMAVVLAANKEYELEFHMCYDSDLAADLRMQFNNLSGAVDSILYTMVFYRNTSSSDVIYLERTTPIEFVLNGDNTNNVNMIAIIRVNTGSSTVTLTPQFAQGTSNAYNSKILADSFVKVTELIS